MHFSMFWRHAFSYILYSGLKRIFCIFCTLKDKNLLMCILGDIVATETWNRGRWLCHRCTFAELFHFAFVMLLFLALQVPFQSYLRFSIVKIILRWRKVSVAVGNLRICFTVTITMRTGSLLHCWVHNLKYPNRQIHPISLNDTVSKGSYNGKVFLSCSLSMFYMTEIWKTDESFFVTDIWPWFCWD